MRVDSLSENSVTQGLQAKTDCVYTRDSIPCPSQHTAALGHDSAAHRNVRTEAYLLLTTLHQTSPGTIFLPRDGSRTAITGSSPFHPSPIMFPSAGP